MPGPQPTAVSTVQLEVRFDLQLRELSIGFTTADQALLYQRRNPEARISLHKNPYTVWLPAPPTMTSLRSSSMGMALMFSSADAARDWMRRSVLGFEISRADEAGIVIKREWDRHELEARLANFRLSRSSTNSLEAPPQQSPGQWQQQQHQQQQQQQQQQHQQHQHQQPATTGAMDHGGMMPVMPVRSAPEVRFAELPRPQKSENRMYDRMYKVPGVV